MSTQSPRALGLLALLCASVVGPSLLGGCGDDEDGIVPAIPRGGSTAKGGATASGGTSKAGASAGESSAGETSSGGASGGATSGGASAGGTGEPLGGEPSTASGGNP